MRTDTRHKNSPHQDLEVTTHQLIPINNSSQNFPVALMRLVGQKDIK
jgi:hypothetical protein